MYFECFFLCVFRRNSNGDTENQELWNYSYSYTSLSGLHNHHVFAPFPTFAVDQPLEMTKQSLDPTRSMLLTPGSSTSRQQVRIIRSKTLTRIFFKTLILHLLLQDVLLNVFPYIGMWICHISKQNKKT